MRRGNLGVSLLLAASEVGLRPAAAEPGGACRDRLKHPFSASSIWNTAIGSDAVFLPANIYPRSPAPPPGTDLCAAGKANPSARTGCPGWQPQWTVADCLRHSCCYDPHPDPDPHHYSWCFAQANADRWAPARMYVDIDYFIAASSSDPATPFVDQGWWGSDSECGRDHCCRKPSAKQTGTLPFPRDWTVNMTSNNAAALLMPDQETLVQFQPLVRCTPGSPLFSLPPRDFYPNRSRTPPTGLLSQNASILGEGTWGAHGGSHLSSIGGTIRLGELLPHAPPIPHAIKLMLFAARYYWPGNASAACYRWPALNCDGAWNASRDPANGNFYNGTNEKLKPGALLAVPETVSTQIAKDLKTVLGGRMLAVLTDYGGYLDDNTASNSGAFNVEGGVVEEVAAAYDGLALNCGPPSPFYEDMVSIFRGLHIVDNNAPGSKGGGGHPRRPPAPPICPVSAHPHSYPRRLKTTDETEDRGHGCNGDPLVNATQICTCLGNQSDGGGSDSRLPPCPGCE